MVTVTAVAVVTIITVTVATVITVTAVAMVTFAAVAMVIVTAVTVVTVVTVTVVTVTAVAMVTVAVVSCVQLQQLVTDVTCVQLTDLCTSHLQLSVSLSTVQQRAVARMTYQSKVEQLLSEENCFKLILVSQRLSLSLSLTTSAVWHSGNTLVLISEVTYAGPG